MSSIRGWIRQRRFPPEFRIEPAAQSAEPGEPTSSGTVLAVEESREVVDLSDPVLADIVTHLWRTTRKVVGDDADQTGRRRPAERHLRATWDALAEVGVEVRGHDDLTFDPGLMLDVAAYEPRPGLVVETVVETVRPSVYRAGRCIQVGQVIVGQPE